MVHWGREWRIRKHGLRSVGNQSTQASPNSLVSAVNIPAYCSVTLTQLSRNPDQIVPSFEFWHGLNWWGCTSQSTMCLSSVFLSSHFFWVVNQTRATPGESICHHEHTWWWLCRLPFCGHITALQTSFMIWSSGQQVDLLTASLKLGAAESSRELIVNYRTN